MVFICYAQNLQVASGGLEGMVRYSFDAVEQILYDSAIPGRLALNSTALDVLLQITMYDLHDGLVRVHDHYVNFLHSRLSLVNAMQIGLLACCFVLASIFIFFMVSN